MCLLALGQVYTCRRGTPPVTQAEPSAPSFTSSGGGGKGAAESKDGSPSGAGVEMVTAEAEVSPVRCSV